MTSLNLTEKTTDELVAMLDRTTKREAYLESQGMPTSEMHAISATIRAELSERLGVKV